LAARLIGDGDGRGKRERGTGNVKIVHGRASSRVICSLLLRWSLLDKPREPEYTSRYFWEGLVNGPRDAVMDVFWEFAEQ
jgi:hypothetical protein